MEVCILLFPEVNVEVKGARDLRSLIETSM